MKFVLKIIAIALLCWIAQYYLPWWVVGIIPFLVEAILPSEKGYPFFTGFYGVFLLWFIYALVLDMQSGSILTNKIAGVFFLPQWSIVVVMIAGIIGGIVGGLGSLSGNYFRQAFFSKA